MSEDRAPTAGCPKCGYCPCRCVELGLTQGTDASKPEHACKSGAIWPTECIACGIEAAAAMADAGEEG